MVAEDPLCEAVERGERGVVELMEAGAAPSSCVVVREVLVATVGDGLQRGADSVAQLGRGGFGEGDRGDMTELDRAPCDQRDNTVDEGTRLAGARPGLDEEAHVVGVADAVPGLEVSRGGHG